MPGVLQECPVRRPPSEHLRADAELARALAELVAELPRVLSRALPRIVHVLALRQWSA